MEFWLEFEGLRETLGGVAAKEGLENKP